MHMQRTRPLPYQVDLVPSTKKKKKKKEEEFVEEYFILLNSKHLVHFQPTTGFVDPFKKTISGKAIDLLHSSVKMSDGEADKDLDLNQFEITTGRCLYLLKPKVCATYYITITITTLTTLDTLPHFLHRPTLVFLPAQAPRGTSMLTSTRTMRAEVHTRPP